MRVWHIDPVFLDDRRLRAVNSELHTILSCILRSSKSWSGLVQEFCKSVHYLKKLHDMCVEEMRIRYGIRCGINKTHESSFDIPSDPFYTSVEYEPTDQQLIKDIQDLRLKWEREQYYFGVGREDLSCLERVHGLAIGLSNKEAADKNIATKAMVADHRWWFNEYRLRNPNSRMQDRIDAFNREQDQFRNSPNRVK